MAFKIIVSKKAQKEIENAIEFYSEINDNLALRFYNELTETYKKLEINETVRVNDYIDEKHQNQSLENYSENKLKMNIHKDTQNKLALN